jgi:hypothetical protein
VDAVATKDIAIAVLGGSAAIASILLVFVGLMAAKADSLPERTPDKIIERYVVAAKCGLIPLLAQVIVILSAYFWMFSPSSSLLFYMWSVGFPVALIFFILYSATVTLLL